MKIDSKLVINQYEMSISNRNLDFIEKNKQLQQNERINLDNDKLKEVVNDFTAILMKQMFKTMRDTIPKSKFIDGGFAEDVFTDMLDTEISKLGASQQGFNTLNRLLYQQLQTQMTDQG